MIKNKKGDVPTTILVISTIGICLFALLSFSLTNTTIRNSFAGLAKTEQLNIQTEENLFCKENPSCQKVVQVFSYDLEDRMVDASKSSIVNRRCNCGAEGEDVGQCPVYSKFIQDACLKEGISDPFLLLSLMMQESQCKAYADSGSSVGLMQVNLDNCKSSFYEKLVLTEECYNQLAGISQKCKDGLPEFTRECYNQFPKAHKVSDKCKEDYSLAMKNCKNNLINNEQLNVEIGTKIFRDKYNIFNHDECNTTNSCVPKYVAYCGDHDCQSRCNFEKRCEYEFIGCRSSGTKFYSGWDAALRAYNGWGCQERSNGEKITEQDTYVEEVNERYKILKGKILTTDDKSFSVEDLN